MTDPPPHLPPVAGPPPPKPAILALFPSILMGSIAACAAVLYSNAAETIKTRLQLDLEGTRRGAGQRTYTGVLDAARQIWQKEGLGLHGRGGGLHAGLTAALAYQAAMGHSTGANDTGCLPRIASRRLGPNKGYRLAASAIEFSSP